MNELLLKIIENVCKNENNENYNFEVVQLSDSYDGIFDASYKIAKFYNENFTGNKDFMHIPNIGQTVTNLNKYPIIVAQEKTSKKIIGCSSLKLYDNTSEVNPYFPYADARFFEITGILTREDNIKNGYFGVGKKIYEILIKSFLKYKQHDSDSRLMCVIDSRNNNSLKALKKATNIVGESYGDVYSDIVGYYEVRDTESKELTEAPTFVIEVINGKPIKEKAPQVSLKYDNSHEKLSDCYEGIKNIISEKFDDTDDRRIRTDVVSDNDIVIYHDVDNISLNDIVIDSNGTELGNNRSIIPPDEFKESVKEYWLDRIMKKQKELALIREKQK